MSASDHLNPSQFFHGTTHHFEPGDEISPNGDDSPYDMGDQDQWRTHRVWMTSRPDTADQWANNKGGDHVYEVQPSERPTHHTRLTEFDHQLDDPETEADQYHAPSATVVRKVRGQ